MRIITNPKAGDRTTCPGCGQTLELLAMDGWSALDGSVTCSGRTTHSDHITTRFT